MCVITGLYHLLKLRCQTGTSICQYIRQLRLNMLVLTGLVKGVSRLVHEMLGA